MLANKIFVIWLKLTLKSCMNVHYIALKLLSGVQSRSWRYGILIFWEKLPHYHSQHWHIMPDVGISCKEKFGGDWKYGELAVHAGRGNMSHVTAFDCSIADIFFFVWCRCVVTIAGQHGLLVWIHVIILMRSPQGLSFFLRVTRQPTIERSPFE